MQNFEIKFGLEVKVDPREYREGNLFGRIISVQTHEIARKIAEAMLGEEVFPLQYLSKVLSVEPTDKEPFISSYCSRDYTWERVLQRLGFIVSLESGEIIIFSSHQVSPASRAEIISGISFNPKQIQRVLTCVLKM